MPALAISANEAYKKPGRAVVQAGERETSGSQRVGLTMHESEVDGPFPQGSIRGLRHAGFRICFGLCGDLGLRVHQLLLEVVRIPVFFEPPIGVLLVFGNVEHLHVVVGSLRHADQFDF